MICSKLSSVLLAALLPLVAMAETKEVSREFRGAWVPTVCDAPESFIQAKGEVRPDPVVPFKFSAMPDYETGLTELRRLRTEHGIRRVFIVGIPAASCRVDGFPSREEYTKGGELIARIRKDVAKDGIQVGWWCAPTIKCGLNAPYQHIVDQDGNVSPHGLCPADPAWRGEFAGRIAETVRLGRPEAVLFEDDLALSCHPGTGLACYCPHHLADMAKRLGRSVTREELVDAERHPTLANRAVRRALAAARVESVAGLAAAVRAEVDKYAPETPLGPCVTGCEMRDGGLNPAVCRAFAGPRCRPFLRPAASVYSCFCAPSELPGAYSMMLRKFETLPPDIVRFAEVDTNPHTRFYSPDSYIELLNFATASFGMDDALFYGTQYLDDPLEGGGYFKSFAKYRAKLAAYRTALRGGVLDGLQIWCDETAICANRAAQSGSWDQPRVWGRLGFPCTTRTRDVCVITGDELADCDDATVRALLEGRGGALGDRPLPAGGVLLDVDAARNVCARGMADLIGADVESVDALPAVAERIEPAAGVTRLKGRLLYNNSFAPAGRLEKSALAQARNPRKGLASLVSFVDSHGRDLGPSVFRFENAAGGRVGVVLTRLTGNYSSSLFSMRKKEVLRLLFAWLGRKPLPVAVADEPNVWPIVNRCPDGSTVLMLSVLRADVVEDLAVFLEPALRSLGEGRVEELQSDGSWQTMPPWTVRPDGAAVIPGTFAAVSPRVFRFRGRPQTMCDVSPERVDGG